MEPDLARKIHEKGTSFNGRVFRLFTFSRLIGEYKISADKRWIRFPSKCSIVISSPIDEILRSVASRLLNSPILRIGFNQTTIESLQAENVPVMEDPHIRVRTLSPIVAYNTLKRMDGRKYTLYHQPSEKEFATLLHHNLLRKLAAMAEWSEAVSPGDLSSEFAVSCSNARLHILKYRDFIIKGYSGTFRISGSPILLRMGIEAGFGSKNSQGFGCVSLLGSSSLRKEGISR